LHTVRSGETPVVGSMWGFSVKATTLADGEWSR
jgi:hypothetical protein